MRTNVLPEIKSCSVAARVVAYLLSLVPIGYLAVSVSFIAIAADQFDHRFIAMSQSGEVRIPFWILSLFSAAFLYVCGQGDLVLFHRIQGPEDKLCLQARTEKGNEVGQNARLRRLLEVFG